MLHQDVKNRGYLAKTKTCQTLDAHVNTFSFFVNSANTINEDYKWSRENRDSAAALTQTVWLFVHIKTLVCVITKQTNKQTLPGSGVKGHARKALQEGFSLVGENCNVYTVYTNACIGLTVGTTTL